MKRYLAVLLAVLLGMPSTLYADSLSISAWSTGDALNATNLNSRHTTIQNLINGNLANDNIKSSAGIVGSKLDLTSGTGRISHSTSVTDDAPILTSAQTWDDVAEVFSGWRLTVTNTNSASTSRLLDLRVGSTIIASISRTGQFILAPQAYASGPTTMMEGAWFNIASATMTDNRTAASGTAPRFIAYAFQRPAIAAANSSVTTSDAATLFIASAPVAGDNMTLTRRYGVWVDQGDVRIGGRVYASQGYSIPAGFATSGAAGASVYIGGATSGATSNYALWVNDGLTRFNGTRTSGANQTPLTLSDTVTGAQTVGFGQRIEWNSNDAGTVAALAFESGGDGTNNQSQIAFYTQNVAAALTRQATITSTGVLALGTTTTTGAGAGDLIVNDEIFASGAVTITGDLYVNGTGGSTPSLWVANTGTTQFDNRIRYNTASSTTGTATATLGTNAPVGQTTPFVWLSVIASDGTAVFVPAWR